MLQTQNVRELAGLIWQVADLLRGNYKQSDYGKVILPLTVLRRMDCLLADTKQKVLDAVAKNPKTQDPILKRTAKQQFYNTSKFDFRKLVAEPNNLAKNLRNYINGFSETARDIVEKFKFDDQIDKMDEEDLLFLVVQKFAAIDLHPSRIDNIEMGYAYEELIRRFAEAANETAGEHYTPREVVRLMVNLLFISDRNILSKEGIIKTIYDPACGTGGMLSVAEEYLHELNPDAQLKVFGQELNAESYAICKADMLIKGHDPSNVKYGNSFTHDGFSTMKFDYMLTNPPFGVEWKKVQKLVEDEHEKMGYAGRFGAGLPRVNDGSLLFLQHLIAKMKADKDGSRIAIVFNGSPLFSGAAGSGESEIRKWILENDLLEGIVALPDQLFYNTGIGTYIWLLTNRKSKERKGKVQLVNAVECFEKMSRSLGDKRNFISSSQIADISKLYGDFVESPECKIFDTFDFGYQRVVVEQPQVVNGKVSIDKGGKPKPDSTLRDYENIPLKADVQKYFETEILPQKPDSWLDASKTKIGYEINVTKYFYKPQPTRSLKHIHADVMRIEGEIQQLLREMVS